MVCGGCCLDNQSVISNKRLLLLCCGVSTRCEKRSMCSYFGFWFLFARGAAAHPQASAKPRNSILFHHHACAHTHTHLFVAFLRLVSHNKWWSRRAVTLHILYGYILKNITNIRCAVAGAQFKCIAALATRSSNLRKCDSFVRARALTAKPRNTNEF